MHLHHNPAIQLKALVTSRAAFFHNESPGEFSDDVFQGEKKKKKNQLSTYTFLLKKNFSQKFHELGGGGMLFPNNSNIYYTADRAII